MMMMMIDDSVDASVFLCQLSVCTSGYYEESTDFVDDYSTTILDHVFF